MFNQSSLDTLDETFGANGLIKDPQIIDTAKVCVDAEQSEEFYRGMLNGLVTALSVLGQTNDPIDQKITVGAIAYECKRQLGL